MSTSLFQRVVRSSFGAKSAGERANGTSGKRVGAVGNSRTALTSQSIQISFDCSTKGHVDFRRSQLEARREGHRREVGFRERQGSLLQYGHLIKLGGENCRASSAPVALALAQETHHLPRSPAQLHSQFVLRFYYQPLFRHIISIANFLALYAARLTATADTPKCAAHKTIKP